MAMNRSCDAHRMPACGRAAWHPWWLADRTGRSPPVAAAAATPPPATMPSCPKPAAAGTRRIGHRRRRRQPDRPGHVLRRLQLAHRPVLGHLWVDAPAHALGDGANLNGAIPFPADNAWNTDISAAPVDPNSGNLIASIGASTGLFPDFGSGTWNGAPIGIPYVVVPGTQPRVAIHFTQPWDENDPGPYPIPADAKVEGEDPAVPGSGGDRHVLVIDRDNDRLYELYRAFRNGDGSWNAESAALFHLDSNNVRPGGQPGWTSADAAGLPIFPGPGPLRGSRCRRHPPCPALHRGADAQGLGAAGQPCRIVLHRSEPAADGHAGAPQGELCHPGNLQRADPRDPAGAEDLRHDPRRQRLQLVPERRTGSALEQCRAQVRARAR